jgi:hypothetical protein
MIYQSNCALNLKNLAWWMLSGVRHGFGGNGEYVAFSVSTAFEFNKLKKSKFTSVRVVFNRKTFESRKSS